MRLRRLLPSLLMLSFFVTGMSCPARITIDVVSPADGSTVTTFSFPLEVKISGDNAVLGSLVVNVNGTPVPVSEGPAGTFTATVDPGDPLLDHNTLFVSVPATNGTVWSRTTQFEYGPPKARVHTITDPGDLLTGPLAHNQLGDYLLSNDVARFVVQAPGQRDLHSVGQFGGNLIDAELVSNPGTDAFFEIQPSINIETVINAQTAQIVNDGQNGLPAVMRTCGPDDLIDYINASSQVAGLGLSIPTVLALIDDRDYDVEGCTEFTLEPGKRYVKMETIVTNLDTDPVSFYVGDYVNGMGSLEQFGDTNTTPSVGLGEVLATPITNSLSYMGFDAHEGVDYGVVPITFPGGIISSSFTTSGVSFLMHSNIVVFVLGTQAPPVFNVPAGGSNSFVRYFAVGDGSVANTREVEAEVKGLAAGSLSGCVTVGGSPLPGARVGVGPIQAGVVRALVAHFVTDAAGCYGATIPAGNWGVIGGKDGHLYEGGGGVPLVHPVTVPDGGAVVQDIALPAPATLQVNVTDHDSLPMPARVSVVGIDPSPEPTVTVTILTPGDTTTGLLYDQKDVVRRGLSAMEFVGASGTLSIPVEPGDYQVVVSRGAEYSVFRQAVTLTGGATTVVNAQIAPVLDTTGFISSDYHVHLLNSPDSRVALARRALSFAAEGVDNIIATDHDGVTDLNPTIASLGLAPFVHSTVGEEITSFDYGHYNAYPQAVDPTKASGGSTDWAGAAPPGQDFPSFGNYVLTPAQIEAAALGKPQNAGLETVVHINHIGSHFGPLQIDTALEPPVSALADPSLFRLDPGVANFFHPFQALELWNGASVGQQGEFLDERIGVWMNLLNQGYPTTAISDTDTHSATNLNSAGARTWTPASSDAPAAIVDNEIGLAVKAGKAIGGQGCFIETRVVDTETAAAADLTLAGDTLVTATGGDVDLEITVQAPTWAPYDTIEIYRNAATQVTGTSGGVPVQYTALPTSVLSLGAADFTRSTVNVHPAVAGAERYETSKTVTLSGLTDDEWIVVLAKGSVGVSEPMFPVYVHNADAGQSLADLMTLTTGEGGVRALCFTNPLYVDVDGNGDFDAPGVQLAP